MNMEMNTRGRPGYPLVYQRDNIDRMWARLEPLMQERYEDIMTEQERRT